ncbi:hypothetical protein FF1_042305 [Malus domestica]|uniref:uncharacterized protein n=1 Tax=Malus domestica TaxID=3750 RepID=UPI000498DF27|nr:uncharacterized protein LOC103440206 [Malus domestica]
MVGVFRRSLSFPNKINPSNIPNNRNHRPSKVRPPLSRHTRSISLPTGPHPFISHLKEHIASLQSFKYSYSTTNSSSSSSAPFSDWLCEGLTRLKDLHHCLDDTLRLPQTQESLRRLKGCCSVDNLLDQFLRFADIYGIFRTSVLALKQDHSAAQVALRKRNDSQVALYVKARKRMAKEMIKLVNALRSIARPAPAAATPFEYVGDDISYYNVDHELAGVMSEVVQVTVAVSLALFTGVAADISFGGPTISSSKSTVTSSMRATWMGIFNIKATLDNQLCTDRHENPVRVSNNIGVGSLRNLKKKGDEEVKTTLKKMQELEASMAGIETCSETVFRSLINARVSLLNTLTLL